MAYGTRPDNRKVTQGWNIEVPAIEDTRPGDRRV
jgi:hypothetical protein